MSKWGPDTDLRPGVLEVVSKYALAECEEAAGPLPRVAGTCSSSLSALEPGFFHPAAPWGS